MVEKSLSAAAVVAAVIIVVPGPMAVLGKSVSPSVRPAKGLARWAKAIHPTAVVVVVAVAERPVAVLGRSIRLVIAVVVVAAVAAAICLRAI